MPKNRIIYAGVVVVVATVLVWLGAELTKRIEWLLPYAAAAGVILLVAGVAQEIIIRRRDKLSQRKTTG
jgi:hypothetical protein